MTAFTPRESELFASMALRLRRIADEIRANPRAGCNIDRRIDGYASAIEADLGLTPGPHSGTRTA